MGGGVATSEEHPICVIDAAAKLPSPVDAIAAVDRARRALP